MPVQPLGIHHVTAVASDPQRNVDFYATTLGMRLVKQTVNFDAPDTYHLYYGDAQGSPGSVLTFFPWPGVPRGRQGTGQATVMSVSIPQGSLGWWRQRLTRLGVEVDDPVSRMDEEALSFHDPDGLVIELVAHAEAPEIVPWQHSAVPPEHQVRGFHSVTMSERSLDPTAELFTDLMGFGLVDEADGRYRFDVGEGGPGRRVDVLAEPDAPQGLVAAGTIHHVAFRAPDDGTEAAWREHIAGRGVDVTPIIDRNYFHSIYFREPGGVLLEIATDPPGFTVDEPLLELGRSLRLPPWLEPRREQIAAALPELKLPDEPDDPYASRREGGPGGGGPA
ncbi:MAG: ring-cleaving dioxygenase [Actinomycetota bacterium]